MLRFIQRSLAVKLGVLVIVAVAVGFSLASMMSMEMLTRSTSRLHREAAGDVAASLAAAVRTSMMSGDGAHVRRMISEVKERLPRVRVRILATTGEEVFGEKPRPPAPDQTPTHVRAAVTSGKPVETGDELALPIANGKRCRSCHAAGEVLGVLTVGAGGSHAPAEDPGAALATLTAVIRDGFYRIMLGGQTAPRFNEYFAELSRRVPGLRGAAVYGTDQAVSYGDPALPLPSGALALGLRAGEPSTLRVGGLLLRVAPLRSERRCLGCHAGAEEACGTLVVAFEPDRALAKGTLPTLIETTLEQVMLSGLGRLSTGLLDDVARTGAVRSLTLHDGEGRLVHDAYGRPSPPAHVDRVLRTGEALSFVPEGAPEFVFVEPLRNAPPCQACHGTDRSMRGAVEIVLDTSEERSDVASLQRRSFAYGVATIVLVLVLLALGLYFTVIRPVRAIGSVADLVSTGRLDANVDVHTKDEMGRLAGRVNDMVLGLRQKLELSKFVSRGTLHTVEAHPGAVARGGERRRVAVVFSDVRGFTSFAETHEPEAVVEVLNRYLQAQADVVIRHGGDIDKFVGDEIMARFIGPDMALRATRVAVEMVEAVDALNATRPIGAHRVAVGVGVNVGDAVLGAMGAERRMDFTVIGDAVNLGARLCSAAKPGEVLVTEAVRSEVGDAEGIVFTAFEPVWVKGKHEPVPVYSAAKAPR